MIALPHCVRDRERTLAKKMMKRSSAEKWRSRRKAIRTRARSADNCRGSRGGLGTGGAGVEQNGRRYARRCLREQVKTKVHLLIRLCLRLFGTSRPRLPGTTNASDFFITRHECDRGQQVLDPVKTRAKRAPYVRRRTPGALFTLPGFLSVEKSRPLHRCSSNIASLSQVCLAVTLPGSLIMT